MPSKAALKRVAIYLTVCIIGLTAFAMMVPSDLLSVPVYASNGIASMLLCAWFILRSEKKKEQQRREDAERADQQDPKAD